MTVSKVSIASNALLMLGAKPISSFDEAATDNLDRARIVANVYPTVKAAELRSHPWNCATKRVLLAPLAAAPAFGWAYAFQLPGDWLRSLSVGQEGEVVDYAMEGRTVLCDQSSLSLRYVADIDEALFDAQLVEAVEHALAAKIAYAITSSAAVAQAMEGKAAEVRRRARATNGQEDTGDQFGEDGMLAARLGGNWSRR